MKIFLRDRLKSLTPDNRPTSEASKWEKNLNTSGITFIFFLQAESEHSGTIVMTGEHGPLEELLKEDPPRHANP